MTVQSAHTIDTFPDQTDHNDMTIAFQGALGAFGYEAAQTYITRKGTRTSQLVARSSFAEVFHAVAAGEVNYGLVPLENSQAGSINEVYDLLRQHDLFVIDEIGHPVNHCLLALPGQKISDIRRVISHPQALAQCDVYLRELGVEVIATYNTAESAKMIRENQLHAVAAIASMTAAQIYALEVLADGVQTIKENYTRFIVLGREPAAACPGNAKTMLLLATAHQPGSLHTCLGFLAENKINLLKLESRPSRQRAWEYVFFLEIEGYYEDPIIQKTLYKVAAQTTMCKVLGSFLRSV